jgi:hypothetical protein
MNRKTKRVVGAAIAVTAAALLTAPKAGAGPYRVAICNPDVGARHADATFQRTSAHYVSDAGCSTDQPGLVVRHAGKRTGDSRWGAWTVHAPRGTVFTRLAVNAAGHGGGGHLPQLLAIPPKGVAQVFGTPDPGIGRSRFTSPARVFTARLSCRRVSGCGAGRKARIRVKRIALELRDGVRPTIAVGGGMLRHGSKRGVQPIAVAAKDVGGGVHRFLVQVNGQPMTAYTAQCRIQEGWALRLRPCPPSARTIFRMQTAAVPFHQGSNTLRICSADYAAGTSANRSCATRRINVDNLCPVSRTGAAPRLEAHLVRERTGDGRGRSVAVRGRLLSANGAPVVGARVCVATRVPIPGNLERVAAAPTTGADGRFVAGLPDGPNRQVRVAYWWSYANVAERRLSLRVHAHPRLVLRPHHPLHNGRAVRFAVELQSPAAEERWVRVQARSGHHWVEVRNGRTNADGIYRARYRFHATTGRRRYRFRAVVPSQRGYPYERGRSRVHRVTVIG